MHSTLFTIASWAALTGVGAAQSLLRTVPGAAAGERFGKALLRAGDVNADGYDDLLVGAPGFNQARGRVLCVSGAYLASGAGAPTLWTLAPGASPGDEFGFALADAGDMTGDGVRDFFVGQPGYDGSSSTDVGALCLIEGAAQAQISLRVGIWPGARFGSAIATLADSSGDGLREVAVGAPGPNSTRSLAYCFFDGADFLGSGSIGTLACGYFYGPGSDQIGFSIASGFDLDGDGFEEFAAGAPGRDSMGLIDNGTVTIGLRKPPFFGNYIHFSGLLAGERLGESVEGAHDLDGNGLPDIVAGAPHAGTVSTPEVGRVWVYSPGAALSGPFVQSLRWLAPDGAGAAVAGAHFGAALSAGGDVDGDGTPDIVVGAPDFASAAGRVEMFSGATLEPLGGLTGASGDRLGDALLGTLDDLDADGFADLVVGASTSDTAGADSGSIACVRLFPVAPQTYCTGSPNSLGCTAAISFSGAPSASVIAPFLIQAANVRSQRAGFLLYAHAPATAPAFGGLRCVWHPIRRTPLQTSGGSASGNDCTGAFAIDFGLWIRSGSDPSLVAGAQVFAQYLSADAPANARASFSNALRFVVAP